MSNKLGEMGVLWVSVNVISNGANTDNMPTEKSPLQKNGQDDQTIFFS